MIARTICEIVSLKFENTSSLNNYVSQVKILHNKLNNMIQENEAFQLLENVLAIFMLINLPTNQFHHIIQSLLSNKSISVKQVSDRLISELASLMKNTAGKEMAMYGFKSKPGNNNTKNHGPDDKCHIHKFGSHTNGECNAQKNKKHPKSAPMAPGEPRTPAANAAVSADATENMKDVEVASIAVENAFVIVHKPEMDYYLFTGTFIANLGASIHLVNNIIMLINPTKCEPKYVNIANLGSQVIVNTRGSVQVLARNNHDQRVSIDIPNVFYFPDLATNLLSIEQIINSGANVSFSDNTMTIEFKRKKVHIKSVTLGNTLWTVSAHKQSNTHFACLCADIWHARFGHPSLGLWVEVNSPKSPLFVNTV
jgi:hypothetical protein